MKLHLSSGGNRRIRGFENGCIKIGEEQFCHSLLVLGDEVSRWEAASLTQLQTEHWHRLLLWEPEVVLLGTGSRMRFLAVELTRPLIEAGIGLEVMSTAAACRTFNILLDDGRRVAAAFFMD